MLSWSSSVNDSNILQNLKKNLPINGRNHDNNTSKNKILISSTDKKNNSNDELSINPKNQEINLKYFTPKIIFENPQVIELPKK